MPAKNSIKEYVDEGYYHIYNRGVEKRDIFLDTQDYHVFLKYLQQALSDPDLGPGGMNSYYVPQNFSAKIELLGYCLMPNHVHLIIKQHESRSIEGFARSIFTRYSMYFNRRYGRVGSLFQGRYRAARVQTEEYLLHLSRYVHLNPGKEYPAYPYSSFQYFLSNETAPWVNSIFVPSLLSRGLTYRDFMKSSKFEGEDELELGDLTLEEF